MSVFKDVGHDDALTGSVDGGECPANGGSCRVGEQRVLVGMRLKSVAQSRAERSIVDRAANLKQEISTSSRPAHLLRFVHSAVHQKIGRPFGDRGADPQSGTVSLGVVDQPVALAGEITIQRVQGGPQLSRRRDGPPLAVFALKMMHDRANTIDADLAFLALPFHIRQCRRSTSSTITAFAATRAGSSADSPPAVCSRCWSRMAMWNQSRIGGSVTPASARMRRSRSTRR